MDNDNANQNQQNEKKSGFTAFLIKRVVAAVVIIAAVIWALATGVDYLEKPAPWKDRWIKSKPATQAEEAADHQTAGALNSHGARTMDERYPASSAAEEVIAKTVAPPSSENTLDQHALVGSDPY